MSERLLLVLLAAVVLALLSLPLLRRRAGDGAPARTPAVPPPPPDDDAAGLALREIELDREMGKLSEADYRALKARYDAARAGTSASPSPVEALKPAPSGAPGQAAEPESLDERAEALVRRWRDQTVRCPACGERPEPDARYCSRCGRVLAPCPQCGGHIDEPAARFCGRCGAALAA
ncbi:MAG TPA: zinc ribbon domain-containing protein [Gemmatimonadaceae bacterium]|nr:zinc ribbon domain-containing protein [Gemmatimonadaceae bacterium]